ncbi:hypothetical protein B0H12DRAFT_1161333 [Mycena haematopus]|nr:hypothetical protein B0H12DRAFT_1161333 [Mycena haematopus]
MSRVFSRLMWVSTPTISSFLLAPHTHSLSLFPFLSETLVSAFPFSCAVFVYWDFVSFFVFWFASLKGIRCLRQGWVSWVIWMTVLVVPAPSRSTRYGAAMPSSCG